MRYWLALPAKTSSEKASSAQEQDRRYGSTKPEAFKDQLRRLPLEKYFQPAKVSSAIKRRRFMRVVPRSAQLDTTVPIEYLGTRYSGWPIPASSVQSDWVIYCLGAGNEVSFETEVIDRRAARCIRLTHGRLSRAC